MMIEFFEESNVGTRTLPRSVATKAGGFVFVSGQVARDENGVLVAGEIEAHTRQTMKNVAHALALAGCTLDDVVKATVWLDDAREFEAFNRVYGELANGQRARQYERQTWWAPRLKSRSSPSSREASLLRLLSQGHLAVGRRMPLNHAFNRTRECGLRSRVRRWSRAG